MGLEKKALDVLYFLVNEIKEGRLDGIDTGYANDRTNIFMLLYASNDTAISQKAIDLAYDLLKIKGENVGYDTGNFLKTIDCERYKEILPEAIDHQIFDRKFDHFLLQSELVEKGLIKDPSLSKYDEIYYAMNSDDYNLTMIQRKTNRLVEYDAEGGGCPLNYVDLFESLYFPVLESQGIKDWYLTQENEWIAEDMVRYTLRLYTNGRCFELQYDDFSDWFESYQFNKLMNMALINSHSSQRFVILETGDQSFRTGLFEPSIFFPIAQKYEIPSGIIRTNDTIGYNYYDE